MGAIVGAWMGADSEQDIVLRYAQKTVDAMRGDESDVVKTACIRVMRDYLNTLPSPKGTELQVRVVDGIAEFLNSHDLDDMDENVDLADVVLQTLRDTIMANPMTCLNHAALDVLLTMVKFGAGRDAQSSILVDEAFESAAEAMAEQGRDAYHGLVHKVLPSLLAAFDIEDPHAKEKGAMTDVATSILRILAEKAVEPLPRDFVPAVMPRLCRLIFSDVDFYLRQAATLTIKEMLVNDQEQVFSWTDPQLHKNGLEMCFLVIGHLLGPGVDDASAAEVGELAVSLVEKAGAAALGNSMQELLQVLAVRLSTAEHPSLIQSLVMVFARLSILNAAEILNFLSGIPIENTNALAVVMKKWLENSVHFVGFEAIRQNATALVAIYNLHDSRLDNIMVNGDLIPDTSSRIRTRSMAKAKPIQYTIIPASLKLVKVLVNELVPFGGGAPSRGLRSPTAPTFGAAMEKQSSSGSWESEPSSPGLSPRASDDATQKFLVDFFRQQGAEKGFQDMYAQLTEEEKKRCMDAVEGYAAMEAQRAALGHPA
jgi:importin-9